MARWNRLTGIVIGTISAIGTAAALCASVGAVAAHATDIRRDSVTDKSAESTDTRRIRDAAHAVGGHPSDYDALLASIGDARIVLLGEDTHGTREFYIERARITRRLIEERGFSGVVIEGDWSETLPLRDAAAGHGDASSIDHSLHAFRRFPQWMWSNTDFRDFARWLRGYNLARRGETPATVHGMDLYDVQGSAIAVLNSLSHIDPEAAARARASYGCLESRQTREAISATMAPQWPDIECDQAVQIPLIALMTGSEGSGAMDIGNGAFVDLLQHARIVRNGEEYLRAMHRGREDAWDLRDTHMASTIDLLLSHLDAVSGSRSRLVVWAHNAHVGDIRATSRGKSGRISLGQLLRERYPDDTFIVGLMTAIGTVRAALEWAGPDHVMPLSTPLPTSHAALLQRTRMKQFYVMPGDDMSASIGAFDQPRLQRGIGVRYVKRFERPGGHYYSARLRDQYDAVLFIERTGALRRLHSPAGNAKPRGPGQVKHTPRTTQRAANMSR